MYESDFDPFPCLLHEKFLYLFAAVVLQEIKVFEMDVVLGIEKVVYQGLKLPAS